MEKINENCKSTGTKFNEFELLKLNSLNNQFQTEYLNAKECIESKINYGCSVCGEDQWCGTDGCPLDPQ